MISPPRRVAFKLLSLIDSRRLFSDDALNSKEMRSLDVRDRHLTTEIVYGTLRWQALLDYLLSKLSMRPWLEVTVGAKILLRMSLYQMWQMDRIPNHALVNDAVELGKLELGKGIERYLNGILRNLARTRPWHEKGILLEAPPWIRVSLPQWLWKRWAERYGETAAEAFAVSLNTPPRAAVRLTRKEAQSTQLPFEAVPSDLVPDAYIQATAGRERERNVYKSIIHLFQDEASQLIAHLLGPPASGWKIWDACAAPGGKSKILSRICGESGYVIASDRNKERTMRMVKSFRDSGTLKVHVIVADAARPAPFRDCFDAILADVPCSGLGTLRRNPEIKWRLKPERLASLQRVQKEILDSVSEAVRVGGHLLYSTCSTEPEENELVVESFLDTHSHFSLERPNYPPGIEGWICPDRMVRTFPSTRLWDGFFSALLVHR